MIITATTKALRVDYRTDGKQYAQGSSELPPVDTPEASGFPFDSQDIAAGESFTLADNQHLVRIVRYEPLEGAAGFDYGV